MHPKSEPDLVPSTNQPKKTDSPVFQIQKPTGIFSIYIPILVLLGDSLGRTVASSLQGWGSDPHPAVCVGSTQSPHISSGYSGILP